MEGREPTVESPTYPPKKPPLRRKKMEKINEKSRDTGVMVWAGVPQALPQERAEACGPASLQQVLLEGGLASGMCVWEQMGVVAPSGFMCALGAGRAKGS